MQQSTVWWTRRDVDTNDVKTKKEAEHVELEAMSAKAVYIHDTTNASTRKQYDNTRGVGRVIAAS